MQQAWRSLSERSSTSGAEVDAACREARSSASLARRRFSRVETFVRHVSSTPSQTLSSTERASATRTSWKTVTMPCSCAAFGFRSCSLGAGDLDPARVGHVHAAQDLDQRALTRAVLPDEGVDLAGAQLERAVLERLRRAERLGQVLDADEDIGVAGRSGRVNDRGLLAASSPRWLGADI